MFTGELMGRPHSELKAWTPPAAPPAAPQSAPPQLPPEGMIMNSDTEKDQCDSIQASVSMESLEVSNIMQHSNPISSFVALSELSQSPNQDSSSGLPSHSISDTVTQLTEQTQLDMQNFPNSLQTVTESHSIDLLNSVNIPNVSKDIVALDDKVLVYKNETDFQNPFSDVKHIDETENIYAIHMNKNGVMSIEEENVYPSMQYSLEVDSSFPSITVDTEQEKVNEQNNCIDLKLGVESKEGEEQPTISLNE